MIASGLLALALVAEDPRSFAGATEAPADPAAVEQPTTSVEPTTTRVEPTSTTPAAAPVDTTPATTTTAVTTTTTTTTTPAKAPAPAQHSSDGAAATQPKRYAHPRLVIAGGPVVGPHAFGNEECRDELARCETTGTFFGIGANLELRAQVWRPLFVHVRGVIVGNASPRNRDPVYKGLGGGGIGFGAYAKHVFGRAEYLLVATIGDDHFGRPFGDGEVGRDRWGHHAGLFSFGGRLPLHRRVTGELWGGLMVGPKSARQLPDAEIDRRTLLTFLAGINIAYDIIPAKQR
ncbi:MAG TPA: hypothetical protein VG755_32070 [Nannocystaceae bacterium]|nr:hypothetical protein [Nannocystaceae bacterium]